MYSVKSCSIVWEGGFALDILVLIAAAAADDDDVLCILCWLCSFWDSCY